MTQVEKVQGSMTTGFGRRRAAPGRRAAAVVAVYLLALIFSGVDLAINSTATVSGVAWSLLSLSVVAAVVAYGQTVVVLIGGLDLSVPYVMTMAAVVLTEMSGSGGGVHLSAVALSLALGVAIGAVNGLGIVFANIPPVVMTLAMNVILEGVVLVYTNGTPSGQVPSFLGRVMNDHSVGSIPNDAWLLLAFSIVGIILLRATTFGRRVYAVGSNFMAARYSGLEAGSLTVGVYALAGLCSALAGILLAGFAGLSYLGMGDSYLLPSIAAVVIGGTAVTGGKGGFFGTVGAVLFLTSIGFVLSGPSSEALKTIVLGGAILVSAVLFNRAKGSEVR